MSMTAPEVFVQGKFMTFREFSWSGLLQIQACLHHPPCVLFICHIASVHEYQ